MQNQPYNTFDECLEECIKESINKDYVFYIWIQVESKTFYYDVIIYQLYRERLYSVVHRGIQIKTKQP